MHIVGFVLHPRYFGLPANIVVVILSLFDTIDLLVGLPLGIDELLNYHTQDVEQNHKKHNQLNLVKKY